MFTVKNIIRLIEKKYDIRVTPVLLWGWIELNNQLYHESRKPLTNEENAKNIEWVLYQVSQHI